MRVAILVESWGEPWNEGYKNLAKYIVEAVNSSVNMTVIPANKVGFTTLEDFDLIHIFNYSVPLHLFPYFVRRRRPVVKHVAKKELDIGIRPFVTTLLNTKLLWDTFIVTTPILREEIRRLTKGKPVFCLPPPIPTSYFKKLNKEECRQTLGLEPNTLYIGYTGTLNRFRDLGIIARALKLINNEKVKLVLSLTNITSEKFADLKKFLMTNRVKFVNVKDVRLFYSSVDLLIYPVAREGAVEPPLTLLEAMSSGCAVAAYKNVVNSNVISNGHNGFLFSSVESLAEIINNLIKEEFDIEVVARNARKTIIENYDSSILRKSYIELYEKIISKDNLFKIS